VAALDRCAGYGAADRLGRDPRNGYTTLTMVSAKSNITDPRLSAALKSALSVWLDGALLIVRKHADHVAELRKAMGRDHGEVRIVYHMRANAITIETVEASEQTITLTELFREALVPGDIPSEIRH